MARYRKKPVVIEAQQWFQLKDHAEVSQWHGENPFGPCPHCGQDDDAHGFISTLEGGHVVCPGDWIITGVKGEHYPCKPDIFEATYEPVED